MKMHVTVEGVKELRARFGSPLIKGPLKELLTEAADVARSEAEQGIDGGMGIAVRSINKNVQKTNAAVFSVLPQAKNIEEGRSPGGVGVREILPKAIRWKEAVGHPDIGWEVAAEIAARGTKGKRFIERARDATTAALPGLLKDMARKVEAKWEASRR